MSSIVNGQDTHAAVTSTIDLAVEPTVSGAL